MRGREIGPSGVSLTGFGEHSHLRGNQHLQKRGRVTNVSGNREERFGDDGVFIRERVETIAYKMEFLSFVQNCRRTHCIPDFLTL